VRTPQRRPLFARRGALPTLFWQKHLRIGPIVFAASQDPKRNCSLNPGAHCPVMLEPPEAGALPAAPDLAAAAAAWLVHLARERRLSGRTIEAYGRDARQFLAFLEERFGGPPGIADFTGCAPGDLRAFLAHRRAQGVEGRSLQRALSALKSLARHIARESGETAAALGAIRAPKAARRLPRPLGPSDAKAVTTKRMQSRSSAKARSRARRRSSPRCAQRLRITCRFAPMFSSPPARCSLARKAARSRRVSCSSRWRACAARSACLIAPRPTRFAIRSPPIFWLGEATCEPSRTCSAMPRCQRRRSIQASTARASSPLTGRPIRGLEPTHPPIDDLGRGL
jgi:hypothetical protein